MLFGVYTVCKIFFTVVSVGIHGLTILTCCFNVFFLHSEWNRIKEFSLFLPLHRTTSTCVYRKTWWWMSHDVSVSTRTNEGAGPDIMWIYLGIMRFAVGLRYYWRHRVQWQFLELNCGLRSSTPQTEFCLTTNGVLRVPEYTAALELRVCWGRSRERGRFRNSSAHYAVL